MFTVVKNNSERGASIIEYLCLNAVLVLTLMVCVNIFSSLAAARLTNGVNTALMMCTRDTTCGGSTEGTVGNNTNRFGGRNPDF